MSTNMTASNLRAFIETSNENSHFFSRKNMKFSGDTMRNYGVRSKPVTIETNTGEMVECWELYRKKPVKHGLRASAYFDISSGQQRFPKLRA